MSVWFQINRKMVNTIWFLFDLIRLRKHFSACRTKKTVEKNNHKTNPTTVQKIAEFLQWSSVQPPLPLARLGPGMYNYHIGEPNLRPLPETPPLTSRQLYATERFRGFLSFVTATQKIDEKNAVRSHGVHTEKYFLNLVNSKEIWIVITLFRLN